MHPQPCAPLLYGSVCSGIEAVSLAWQPLGLEAAWFAEIEPFPSAAPPTTTRTCPTWAT